jgi:hypothetical protein
LILKITTVAAGAIILAAKLPSGCPFTPDVTVCSCESSFVHVTAYLPMLIELDLVGMHHQSGLKSMRLWKRQVVVSPPLPLRLLLRLVAAPVVSVAVLLPMLLLLLPSGAVKVKLPCTLSNSFRAKFKFPNTP